MKPTPKYKLWHYILVVLIYPIAFFTLVAVLYALKLYVRGILP